ncbi:nitroreductase family protein [Porticoccaceae bacterium]|nr:nitroreductase family protein [Porticoccaceae bacterium]
MAFKATLKGILPRAYIDRMQVWRERLDVRLARLAAYNRWTAALYYLLYSGEFGREMHAVLQARRRYYEARGGLQPNSYLLRRNIHRLEKGLIMLPRRPLFGVAYITETVDYLQFYKSAQILTDTEWHWATGVLDEYFLRVQETPLTVVARNVYTQIVAAAGITPVIAEGGYRPLAYSALPPPAVSYGDLTALCERRHSVRWFTPQPVPQDLLNSAIDVAATAPSACNRQPFKFYVYDQPERAQEIASIAMGTAGFAHNFQCVLVIVGDLSAYPFEKDRHIIYIDGGLAAMQLQLALETQGLASCCINWPDIEHCERQMGAELSLEPYQRPLMLLAVGYALAHASVPYSAKKTAADLVVRPK